MKLKSEIPGKSKFAKAIAGRVSGTGILRCLAMFLLAAFGPVPAHAQSSGFVYVANNRSNNVSGYTINGTTGALTPVPGSPFRAETGPRSVTVDPTGHFVYVANNITDNVSAYVIDGTTGTLTEVPGSPYFSGLSPVSVTVDPTGQFAYVANYTSGNVSA